MSIFVMMRFLPIVFLAGGLLEIASIIWVGSAIGVIATLLLLMCGGLVGMGLLRSAGANAATVLRSSIQDRRMYQSLAGTTMVRIFAGVLFIVPGFFSDVLALLLLVLPVNQWIARKAGGTSTAAEPTPGERRLAGQVIDGEAFEITGEVDFEPPRNGRS